MTILEQLKTAPWAETKQLLTTLGAKYEKNVRYIDGDTWVFTLEGTAYRFGHKFIDRSPERVIHRV